jgi:restriction system protein
MTEYLRVYAGRKAVFLDECIAENYIGVDFDIDLDISEYLDDDWPTFRNKFKDKFFEIHPQANKISGGLAIGSLWWVCCFLKQDDIVITSDSNNHYRFGLVKSPYFYNKDNSLMHCRKIEWSNKIISKNDFSRALQKSLGSSLTTCHLTKYSEELDKVLNNKNYAEIISTDDTIEEPSIFALEKHLEDFLVENWANTKLGEKYEIYHEDGEIIGQQYPSDTGPMDILAVSKDKKELLVVELKKGRVSDSVVGQIQRYMGFCIDELADEGQEVKGIIIGLKEDKKLTRALRVTKNIEFFKYKVHFDLIKS